jgi:DNA-binding transcriptional MerR regulator
VPDDGLLTSGEFARRAQLSVRALRLYDRIGLLRPAEVEPGNGYRRYHESQLYAARLIALLRRLDMPLAHIATVVEARGPGAADLLDRYWTEVEERLAARRDLADRLVRSLSGESPAPAGEWDVRIRDVGAQTVLTEQRLVTTPDLPWIRTATARLTTLATGAGGPAGPHFVIFHSPVTEDTAGPVEVCVPVAADRLDPAAHPLRVEPAHREAYIPVEPGHFEPPMILSVYDAVRRWARDSGYRAAGAPREVYGYPGDGPGPVCDVALPVAPGHRLSRSAPGTGAA